MSSQLKSKMSSQLKTQEKSEEKTKKSVAIVTAGNSVTRVNHWIGAVKEKQIVCCNAFSCQQMNDMKCQLYLTGCKDFSRV